MPRDTQTKLSNKDIKKSRKQEELSTQKKKNQDSDSDNDNISCSDSDEEKSDKMDVHEYRKFISKIFPSKHINKKIKAGNKLKKTLESDNSNDDDDDDWETESSSSEEKLLKKSKKKSKNNKKKIIESETEDDTEISLGEEDTEDEDEDSSSDYIDSPNNKNKGKINIVFTVGGLNDNDSEDWNDDDYDPDEDSQLMNDETEDEDEEVSTDEDDDDDENDSSEEITKSTKEKKLLHSDNKSNKNKENPQNTEEESNETLKILRERLAANPKDKSIQKCIDLIEKEIKESRRKIEKKTKKQKAKNMRIFRKIMKDKNTMNDFTFYEKMDSENQKKIIKELREINKITRIEKPYRITLLESSIPVQFKSAAMKKINSLRYMEPGSGEFYKIKNWVDTFMRIPFTYQQNLPITIEDGVEKCHEFMENAQKVLDQAVYGLNDAKMQIMQMLGQLITNPKAIGTAIAIHGPPGTGKTSLVKEGISKILNRPFAFIALGGATDSSFLEGHGYTYEGSTWGKIVQILIDSKCMNPVIYFDELDKISDTPKGEEIAGILTHLTDTSQNSQFHDKYFAEINFDLSKCLFIFSYNDESKVNPILKDRMYRIKTKGYVSKEKTEIANNYLLPRIREQVRFNNEDIIISNDIISHIIDTHCNKEDGVRNLKRCLEIIYTKLNLYRLMKPGSNLFEKEMSLKVEFPFKVTKDIVDKLIKKEQENSSALWSMYV
jgi:ATP-dependent Lon protease